MQLNLTIICFRIKKYQIQNNIILISDKNETLLAEDKWSDKSAPTKVKTKFFTTPCVSKITPKVGILFYSYCVKRLQLFYSYTKTQKLKAKKNLSCSQRAVKKLKYKNTTDKNAEKV